MTTTVFGLTTAEDAAAVAGNASASSALGLDGAEYDAPVNSASPPWTEAAAPQPRARSGGRGKRELLVMPTQ